MLGGIVIQRSILVDVDIDIKPCLNNDGDGVIPVAILGAADFDVTQVDPSTVKLQGQRVASRGKSGKLLAHVADVNGDGFDDLVIQIEDVDGTFTSGSGTATLTGCSTGRPSRAATTSVCRRRARALRQARSLPRAGGPPFLDREAPAISGLQPPAASMGVQPVAP